MVLPCPYSLTPLTPLLQVVGCAKIARLHHTRAYRMLAATFMFQFALFRLVIANGYLMWLLHKVLQVS